MSASNVGPAENESTEPDPMTVATYELLSNEYDDVSHATTRALERASLQAFAAAATSIALGHSAQVLELGCGSGALTMLLAQLYTTAEIVATDPSRGMLEVAASKVGSDGTRCKFFEADADRALRSFGSADLVAGSLCDPYLDPPLAGLLANALVTGSQGFFSLPSRSWARSERRDRLHVPPDTTRFRTRSGTELLARSFTYDQRELEQMMLAAGLNIVAAGLCADYVSEARAPAEVAWVLVSA